MGWPYLSATGSHQQMTKEDACDNVSDVCMGLLYLNAFESHQNAHQIVTIAANTSTMIAQSDKGDLPTNIFTGI